MGQERKIKRKSEFIWPKWQIFQKKKYVLAFLLFKKILKFVQERKFLLNKNDL